MSDLRPAYVFGPWVTSSASAKIAYRAAPREDDRAEVWLYVSEDGAESYWCGCWGGMADSVEIKEAKSLDEAKAKLDELIVGSGHYLAEVLALGLAPNLSHLAALPGCEDCPIGGREGPGPVCPRAALCDLECAEYVRVMEAEGLQNRPPHRVAIDANGECRAHGECGCIMPGDSALGCEWESFCHHHLPASAPENGEDYRGDWEHPDFQSNGGCSCECHPSEHEGEAQP